MCLTTGPAQLSGTTQFGGIVHRAGGGRPMHLMGYQNHVVNQHSGPNAMILFIPATDVLGEGAFIDTDGCQHIFSDMVSAVTPQMNASFGVRGREFGAKSVVKVFDRGIYRWVSTNDPSAVPQVLQDRVDDARRPVIPEVFFSFAARMYPGYNLLVGCFNNQQRKESEPILIGYEPVRPDKLVMPAIDGHGAIPAPGMPVRVQHWLLASSDRWADGIGEEVHYRDPLSRDLRRLLPQRVIGEYRSGEENNGDWILDVAALQEGTMSVERGILDIS